MPTMSGYINLHGVVMPNIHVYYGNKLTTLSLRSTANLLSSLCALPQFLAACPGSHPSADDHYPDSANHNATAYRPGEDFAPSLPYLDQTKWISRIDFPHLHMSPTSPPR